MVPAHITGGVNIYWYGCVSLLAPKCAACVYACVISNQSTIKNHLVSDLSKLEVLLRKTHIKVLLVLRYQSSTYVDISIVPLSKVYSARKTQHKERLGWGLEVTKNWWWEGGESTKFERVAVCKIGSLHKMQGLAPLKRQSQMSIMKEWLLNITQISQARIILGYNLKARFFPGM